MAILNNNAIIGASGNQGYNLQRSLRFRRSASAYLSRTPASAGSQTTWTWSGWIKRGALGLDQIIITAGSTNNDMNCYITGSGDQIYWFNRASGTFNALRQTTQVFRDPSAWYHVVLVWDTTNATASNRMRIYVNGVQVTAFASSTDPSSSMSGQWNGTSTNRIFSDITAGSNTFDGYLTEVNFIDGQALTPSSFGSTNSLTGVWQPAKYTGTYGTNGFYLPFTDNSALTTSSNAGLGKDFSGNSNYWVTNNISITSGTTYDSMTDVSTLTSATAANYAVLNPVFGSTNVTFSEANLKAQVGSTGGIYRTASGTFAVSSGKWYWELVFGNPTTGNPLAGIGDITVALSSWNADTSTNANFWYLDASSGNKINGSGGPGTAYGSSFTTSDICMVALDMDNGKIWWGKNGTWFASGDPVAGTNAAYTTLANKLLTVALMGGCGSCGFSGNIYQLNFGQRPFSYTPPTGYVALNTYNLPTPTILKGNTVMDATLWTGNGATNRTIANTAGFKPDLVWTKGRSTTWQNFLQDSTRGATNFLISDTTGAEGTTTPSIVSSFASNGFVIQNNGNSNNNGDTYIGWQWKANGGTTSSNTSGSITSTVQANTTAGFSVISYTTPASGNITVGHGLGVAPSMIIVKQKTVGGWIVYHKSTGANGYLQLNATSANTVDTTTWNNTSPTSSVFSMGGISTWWSANTAFITYAWAEIAGFSKFGSYVANGSADNTFVYTGFRPKYLLIKCTTAPTGYESWFVFDSVRNTYNSANLYLNPNTSGAEGAGTAGTDYLDIVSNGFKLRGTGAPGVNGNSGATYIYAAFAESPFKNSLAR